MVSVGLTGFSGGKLKKINQFGVHVQTPIGEYGPVEDIHMILDHLVGAYLLQNQNKVSYSSELDEGNR